MDSFITWYEELGRSPHSVKAIKDSLNRLLLLLDMKYSDMKNQIKKPKETLNKILGHYSISTTLLLLNVIKMILKKDKKENLIEIYDEYIAELRQEKEQEAMKQQKNNHEEENWVDYLELKKIVADHIKDGLKKKISFTRMRLLILISIYTQMPPSRISNYLNMEIINNDKQATDDNKNYFNKKKNEFIFNNYKTSKYLGTQKYKIEDENFIKLIHKWLSPEYNNTNYFLTDLKGRALTPNQNISKLITNASETYIKKKINLNLFRKIFLTWFLSTNPSIQEKEKIFNVVGQVYNPSVSEKYYQKIDDKEEK
jgi:hypothetical protein